MRYYTDPQILMDDIRGGRSEAFEYLFKTYYPRLRSYASHFIADVDDTEDIVQDCLPVCGSDERRLPISPCRLFSSRWCAMDA